MTPSMEDAGHEVDGGVASISEAVKEGGCRIKSEMTRGGGFMDLEMAYQVLGVAPGSDAAVIEMAYKELAAKRHPDRGGSHDSMAELNEARAVALASVARGVVLSAAVLGEILVKASNQQAERQELNRQSETLTKRLIHATTSRLRTTRLLAGGFGAITAVGLFVIKEMPGTPFQTQAGGGITFVILLLVAAAALTSWILTTSIASVEQSLVEFAEDLEVRSLGHAILRQLLREKLDTRWTFADLQEGLDRETHVRHERKGLSRKWFGEYYWVERQSGWESYARWVGARRMAQLVTAKCKQSELIREVREPGTTELDLYELARPGRVPDIADKADPE